MSQRLVREVVGRGHDGAALRQKARRLAEALDYDPTAQTRIATGVWEAVRSLTAAGDVEISFEAAAGMLRISVRGVASGEDEGLVAAQRLFESARREQLPDGRIELELGWPLPEGVSEAEASARLGAASGSTKVDPAEAAADAAREAARLFEALEARNQELERLNRELEETNRGVVALYAELDEKAEALRRVSEIKSRFISNVSHEFRTPINSVLSLSRLLLDKVDGPLEDEQEKQVTFIRKSAEALSELVNDLLDLAKIESGKIDVRPAKFEVSELFAALRGIMKPLLTNDRVALMFEVSSELPPLYTDEGKLSQILRNLVGNALKFTERGEVRVRAAQDHGGIHFEVKDTGIGIAPEHLERVFEEFVQVEGPQQRRHKGTGLGLPLSRRLAELLGGTLTVESVVGGGSTFHLRIPRVFGEALQAEEVAEEEVELPELDPERRSVLVVEDDPQTLFVYEKFLKDSGFQVVSARSVAEARGLVKQFVPVAVVLDVLLEGDTSWSFLGELRSDARTREVPVLVVTVIDHQAKARALGADEFCIKPVERKWLLSKLAKLVKKGRTRKVLVIDDDEVARYLVRRALEGSPYELLEAAGGREGLEKARREKPDLVILDLVMPEMNGFDVLDALRAQEDTANIPVIIHSSKALDEEERSRLGALTDGLIRKDDLTREVALQRVREALLNLGVLPAPSPSGY